MSSSASATIRIFSARACAAPLEEAAALYEKRTGRHVDISVCARHCADHQAERADENAGRHDFLIEIAEYGIHDLAISGAEYLFDDGEVRGIVLPGQRRVIAYRKSALIVPKGNPAKIKSLADLARPGIRVGISVIDCLKGTWEDVSASAGLTGEIARNITFHATGCVAIVEAVAEGLVDAAFGWSAFAHLAEGRIEIVQLPRRHCIYRATGVGMLSFTKQPDNARHFMDFLTTPEARASYSRYGWVLPEQLRH
jgi:molybdate transport system substrate-binding protein